MSIDYNVLPLKKGKTRKQLKARKDREDAKQLKAFRDAVWQREGQKEPWSGYNGNGSATIQWAWCQSCGSAVMRCSEALTGEVHHRIFRGNKATRYDPDNGVLLCNHLVNNCHQKVQEGIIKL